MKTALLAVVCCTVLTGWAQESVSIGEDNPALSQAEEMVLPKGEPVKRGTVTMRMVKKGNITYKVADQTDIRKVYRDNVQKDKCFIVISKQEFRLYVYEQVDKDTLLVAHYPVCIALNNGNKQRVGDKKTPESTMKKPFSISQIQSASSWKHDFKDGRGNIPSYGDWFIRLSTPPHTGIGIHGSTSNESSVPGQDSEGCIRLRDNDIIHLKQHYACVNMPVIIKAADEMPLPFEKKAWQKAKDYTYPVKGYTLLKGASFVDEGVK